MYNVLLQRVSLNKQSLLGREEEGLPLPFAFFSPPPLPGACHTGYLIWQCCDCGEVVKIRGWL